MFRQFLIYLLASLIVLMCSHTVQLGLHYLLSFYQYCATLIAPIFNQVGLGHLVYQVFLLTALPIGIVGLPALAYQAMKGKALPYFIECIWAVWLVLSLSLLLH